MYFSLHKHYFNEISVFLSLQKLQHLQNIGGVLLYEVTFRNFIINKNASIEYFFTFELFYFWKGVYNLKV